MEKLLLTIIAASGLCVVLSHVDRQYHFVYDKKNATEALKYCRDKHTDLATIDNMQDVETLKEMVDLSKLDEGRNRKPVWIGLYDDVDSWRWSLSDTSFYKPGEMDFRQWKLGQPDNAKMKEYCTLMNYDGLWSDRNCNTSKMSVCVNVQGLNVTFHLVTETKNWTEAQSFCRAEYTDLASMRNIEDHEKVKALKSKEKGVWIGLFRDSWKWHDGSNSSFRFWADEQEDDDEKTENCVAADFNDHGKWNNYQCDGEKAFICYSPREVPAATKQVFQLRVKKDSGVDLDAPAVMEQIRKQIQQKLKDHGVGGDVNLSWRKQSDGKVFHKDEKKTNKKRRKRDEF